MPVEQISKTHVRITCIHTPEDQATVPLVDAVALANACEAATSLYRHVGATGWRIKKGTTPGHCWLGDTDGPELLELLVGPDFKKWGEPERLVIPADLQDLKPRGEKPPFWLGVRLGTWCEALSCEGGDLSEALAGYLENPNVDNAAVVAASLIGMSEDHWTAACSAVRVFEYGAEKYAPGNFRRAFADMDSMRHEYVSAIMRHSVQDMIGDPADPESGLPHLAHALCGALMLLEGELSQ